MSRTPTALLSILALAVVPAGAQAAKGRDSDHDGLTDRQELKLGTNPHKADTDGDGLKDGAEVRTGNDPLRRSTDADGRLDGRKNAGTVASFANGILTIKLANGKMVSGAVANSQMNCESEAEHAAENEAAHHHRGQTSKAHAARNGGDPAGTSTGGGSSPAVTTTSTPPSTSGGHNGGTENEPAQNENENEPAENENQAEANHQNGNCATDVMTKGTAVHKAVLSGGVFSDVELVHG